MAQQSPKSARTLRGVSGVLFALTSVTPLLIFMLVVNRFDLLQQPDISMLV